MLVSMEGSAFAPMPAGSDTTRQFNADVLEGNDVVLPGTLIELWTRKSDWWHGQILYWADGQLHPNRTYLIRTARESRLVNITDIIVAGGLASALFEQLETPAADPVEQPEAPSGKKRRR